MIRGMTLVTTAVVTLGLGASAVRPASARPGAATRIASSVAAESHTTRRAELPPDAAVVSLSVVPTAGRADVIIGITDVRYSQYRRNVVRVVLTLNAERPYSVVRGRKDVRIAVEGESSRLEPWHVGEGAVERSVAAAPPRTETIEARMASATRAPTRLTNPQQRSQQPRITIAWENADIHDVLAAFAAFSGRTIIPARGVTGSVTAEISNQPWDVAMRAILNANTFDAVEDQNGIIIVDTYTNLAARQAAEPLITRTLRLNYARAASVAPMLQQRLSRDCSRFQQNAGPVQSQSNSQQGPPALTNL